MQQNVGQLEVSVHDLVVHQSLESIKDLGEVPQNLLLRQSACLLDPRQHVPAIAVLQHEVVIMRSLLERVQLDDVRVVAGLQHLYLVLQQLVELA